MEEKQDTKATEKVEKMETKSVEKKGTENKEIKKQEAPKDTKKKFEAPKVENKKIDNKSMIGLAIIVVVILIAVIMFITMSGSPKQSVETMLKDLKSGKYSETVLANTLAEENFDEESKTLLFDKLNWKIKNVKQEGDKATVEVEITNKDFKVIISNYMQKILKLAFGGQSVSEGEMANYLKEELKNEEIQTVTSNQFIVLEKKEGKWKVTEENDFANILLPGFNDALSAYN